MKRSALVLFSGGQDSATCLANALSKYDRVETIGFNYGQRHSIELTVRKQFLQSLREAFPAWAERLGQDHVIDIANFGKISDSALTSEKAISAPHDQLPNTFVPGRNILFFTLAAAVATRNNHNVLVGGMCETDYSGYPDCRDDTLKSLQVTLNLGLNTRLEIETPLMWLSKAQTWELAAQLGGSRLMDLILKETHTCYQGDHTTQHAWGFGCNQCPACDLRKLGFEHFAKTWKSDASMSQPTIETATSCA